MDKLLRPERLTTPPSEHNSQQKWVHWKRTFDNFLSKCPSGTATDISDEDKLSLLINSISTELFDYIASCETYATAIACLQSLFIKPVNVVFARYQLMQRKQQSGETLDAYLQVLQQLAKKCSFAAVTAIQHQE